MQTTESIPIKDFKVGDKFKHYGEIFEVTGELQIWTGHRCAEDKENCYGRSCKIVSKPEPSNISGLLLRYNWMQGTITVKYARLTDED